MGTGRGRTAYSSGVTQEPNVVAPVPGRWEQEKISPPPTRRQDVGKPRDQMVSCVTPSYVHTGPMKELVTGAKSPCIPIGTRNQVVTSFKPPYMPTRETKQTREVLLVRPVSPTHSSATVNYVPDFVVLNK